MKNNENKLNSNWNKIFKKYQILNQIRKHGKFEISANQIKNFREPRLMTKFDNYSQLPQIFSDNNLSILPITRGKYLIAPMKIFHKFPKIDHSNKISYFDYPDHIQSLRPSNIISESLALNAAYLSGILEDFVEDEKLLPTISGKMSSLGFSFKIKINQSNEDINIDINNASIEIDAGFEGLKSLAIIEAKNHITDDFIIRQLYYPYRRLLLAEPKIKKDIKTIFMVYTNNIFYLYEYKFNDVNNYNSLVLNKFKRYSFEKLEISTTDIENIIKNTSLEKEPKVPFPQADNFERIINLCELLHTRNLSKPEITYNYGFDKRQTDYYVNAGRYLGLIQEKNDLLSLSSTGKAIMKKSPVKRVLAFVEQILKHQIFKDTLKEHFSTGEIVSKDRIIQIMKNHSLYNIRSESTYRRRASTISSWIEWITSLITKFSN